MRETSFGEYVVTFISFNACLAAVLAADVDELVRFQDLQLRLVEAGFDTTLRARREENEAVISLTVALHQEQTPELMAKLTEIISAHGFGFTAENETVHITTLDS